jgi:GxxExxY protein
MRPKRRLFEEQLTGQIIGAAIEIHQHLGPGLLESTYQACLCHELELRGLTVEYEKPLPLEYKGVRLDCGYRLDLLVGGAVVVELNQLNHWLRFMKLNY